MMSHIEQEKCLAPQHQVQHGHGQAGEDDGDKGIVTMKII